MVAFLFTDSYYSAGGLLWNLKYMEVTLYKGHLVERPCPPEQDYSTFVKLHPGLTRPVPPPYPCNIGEHRTYQTYEGAVVIPYKIVFVTSLLALATGVGLLIF